MAAQLAACTKEAEEAIRKLQEIKIKSHTTTEEDMRIQRLKETLTTASGRLARAQLCSQTLQRLPPASLRLYAHGACILMSTRARWPLRAAKSANGSQLHTTTSS